MAKVKFEDGMEEMVINENTLNQIKDFNIQLAKNLCPVETGKLKHSIRGVVEGNKITIGSDVRYAEAVEMGTARMVAAHGPHDPKHPVKSWEAKRRRGDTTSLQQMPFLRPAAFLTAEAMKDYIPSRAKINVRFVIR